MILPTNIGDFIYSMADQIEKREGERHRDREIHPKMVVKCVGKKERKRRKGERYREKCIMGKRKNIYGDKQNEREAWILIESI